MKLFPFDSCGIGAGSIETGYSNSVKQNVQCQPISLSHEWKISNCCKVFAQTDIEYIDSTSFSAYSSKKTFFLRLYPNGYETDQSDYVSIFVLRKKSVVNDQCEITDLSVECETTIINQNDGSSCYTKKFFEKFDSNNNFHGFDIFIQRASLLDTKNNLLKDDTLTICCKLNIHINTEAIAPFVISNFTYPWKVKNIHEVENQSASITFLNEYICKHQWTIGEFTLLKNPNPFKPFTIDFPWVSSSAYKKVQFKLILYPDVKQEDRRKQKNVMKMCLTMKSDEISDVKVNFKFFLVDSEQKQREVKVAKVILEAGSKHEWTDFYDRNLLFNEKNQLLSGLDLILSYEAKISLNHVTESVVIPTICILESLQSKLRQNMESDLVLLFEDGLKLYAHKKVLIARSKVFAAQIPTKLIKNDKEEECLNITDTNIEVFEHFLRFIYTGNTLGFEKFAFQLFDASQKYEVEDLKIKCEEWLSENALENATLKCLTLTLQAHNVDTLKNNLIEHFHKKPSNLSNEIFKQLRESNPKFLLEIYPHLDRFLLKDGDSKCDLELKLNDGTVLHAHRAILASKSVVFAAMFQHDTLERESNAIQIPDLDGEICEHLLRFVYTENILPRLDDKTKFDIFVAADKYDLRELKSLTQRWIYAAMTIDSVIDLLVLADMFNVAELKTKAMTFIHENADKVTQTEGFKLLLQNRSDLMVEVYLNIVNISKRKVKSFEEEDISVL